MTDRGFPHGHPRGWFQVAWSQELSPGQVKPARYFGKELVIYRTDSGEAVVMDAHCPHLGAHLGYGGVVEGECIVCPFHGWTWSTDGTLVRIRNATQTSSRVRTHRWQTLEQSGLVLVWFDPDDGEPTWFPPPIPAFEDPDYYPIYPSGIGRDTVRLYPQFVLENMVDFMHLSAVHLWDNDQPKLDKFEAREHSFVANTSGLITTARGPAQMRAFNEAWGVAFVISTLTGLRDSVFVSSVTPIDDDRSDVLVSLAVRRPDGPPTEGLDPFATAMIAAQVEAILGSNPGDRDIWEHQRYVKNPPFMKGEAAGFRALRNWAEDFYSKSSG